MASPARPGLRRQDSKVRFSRTDMSPVGTMASDSTIHGPHHHPQHHHASQDEQEQSLYDVNSYPFAPTTEHDGYSQGLPGEDDDVSLHPHDSESQRYVEYDRSLRAPDEYTSTPPRVGGRQWMGTQQHRPSLDTLLSAEAIQQYPDPNTISRNMSVSPRGSTVLDNHDATPQNRSPYQNRPSSALRSSLVAPHGGLGSPQRAMPQEAVIERLEYPRGSPARSSLLNIGATPPRRMLEQHCASAPTGSPGVGSPQFGSPRQSAPDAFRSPPQGYRRYDEYDRLSPIPPNQSPRNSGATPGERWNRERQHAQGRHDSDATLQGEYTEKRKYSQGDYHDKAKHSPQPDNVREYRRPRSMSSDSRAENMHRRSTREVEDDTDSYHVRGGVFSQLLRLTGRSATLRRRVSSQRSSATAQGDLPTMQSLGLRRAGSAVSTVFGADELDPDDPRVTGQKKKARRSSFSELPFMRSMSTDAAMPGRKKRRASIQYHVAGTSAPSTPLTSLDILTRQQFILKLAKALMTFGAPSHRIESQLSATALVLEVDAQFIHFPSFGDMDTRTSETHFVKAGGGLDLGKLHRVHNVYRAVVHDEMDAAEGSKRIHALLTGPMQYNLWQRMAIAFLCSGIIAPLGFGGSFIDGIASGFLGILLSFLQLHVASKSAMYSNIFE